MNQLSLANNSDKNVSTASKAKEPTRDTNNISASLAALTKTSNTTSVSCNDLFSLIEASNSDVSNTLDLNNNNSNAYKQLVKNLSNHPLSAPPTKLATDKASQFLKAQQKKQGHNLNTSNEGSSILKQLLNINLDSGSTPIDVQELEKKTKSSAKKPSSHQHNKKGKSPKEQNVSFNFLS